MTGVPRLHVITNDDVLAHPRFLDTALRLTAIDGGRIALHVRGHRTAAGTLHQVAVQLSASRPPTSMIFVNDRVDVALGAGSDGIQLGSRSLPIDRVGAWLDSRGSARPVLGYSAHEPGEAVEATCGGADLVLAGTIWASETHTEASPAGTGLIAAMARRVRQPVIAIGGVRPERVSEACLAGAWGVAVIGWVWKGSWPADPEQACGELIAALDEADSNRDLD